MHLPHIAIVGAGFTGASLAMALCEAIDQPAAISLIDARGTFGPGLAYGTSDDCCVVNSPAGRISAFAERPAHFIEWLQHNEPDIAARHPDGFVPRAAYGRYLAAVLAETVSRSDIMVAQVRGQVIGLEREGGQFRLCLDNGPGLVADIVALCTGYGPGAGPARRGRVVDDPWGDWVERVGPDDTVFFKGTGLTTVDQALRLASRGHRGPLIGVSRRGLMPQSHATAAIPAIGGRQEPASPNLAALLRQVRSAATAEARPDGDWRAVVDSLRPQVQVLWSALPDDGRRRFARHLRPYWDVHRHRTAPAVGAWLSRQRAGGRLVVVAGRIGAVAENGQGLSVAVRKRGAAVEETFEASWFVDCSATDRAISAGVLDWSLLSLGVASRNGDKVEVRVGDSATMVDGGGENVPGLYALGPACRERLWEITAVPEIRAQAQQVAAEIAGSLRPAVAASARIGLAVGPPLNQKFSGTRRF